MSGGFPVVKPTLHGTLKLIENDETCRQSLRLSGELWNDDATEESAEKGQLYRGLSAWNMIGRLILLLSGWIDRLEACRIVYIEMLSELHGEAYDAALGRRYAAQCCAAQMNL
jgi:hypothetical protein